MSPAWSWATAASAWRPPGPSTATSSCARSRTSRACRWRRSTPGIDWCFEIVPRVPGRHRRSGPSGSTSARSSATRRCACSWSAARSGPPPTTRSPAMRDARARGDATQAPSASPRSRQPAPPGRVRPSGAEPVRRASTRSTRSPSVLGELGKGVVAGVDRPGPVPRPVLRAGREVRRPGHLDRAGGPGRQARRRPAHRRAGRGPARRGVPADRLPADRDADRPWPIRCRSARSTSGRRCWPVPRDERADLYRDPAWRDRARPTTLDAWSHRWSKIERRGDRASTATSSASRSTSWPRSAAPRRST